jgi:hypothetical protein
MESDMICAACGKPIEEQDFEDRHESIDHKASCNDRDGWCGCPEVVYHEECCPECKEVELDVPMCWLAAEN